MSQSSHAHSKVELKISCENLPYSLPTKVIIFTKDPQTREWISTQDYETEIVDSINPVFVTGIIVDYHFEKLQQFRFTCKSEQRVIGHYECDLGSIVSSRGGKMREKLYSDSPSDKSHALITVSAEEVKNSRGIVTLEFQALNLAKVGFLKLTPQSFLTLSRANEDGTFSPVYKTPNISSTNPLWPEFEMSESALCNSDQDRALKLQVKNRRGDVPLGECTVTLRELLEGNNFKRFPLKLPRGISGNILKDSKLEIKASLKKKSTFLDYIAGGTPINLVIAIDFTESNHDPKDPQSLHYTGNKNKENEYQQAIRSVGTILEQYDSDKKIPVYGFGARFRGNISHAYPLNNNFKDAEVDGIDGVMNVYLETINSVELHGPTNFSPIINQTAATIMSEMKESKEMYYILLIITDGVITDMDTTIRAIIKAMKLPLSIVIVGVGDADFSNMEILDNEVSTMQYDADEIVKRKDIVKFVAMRDFKSGAAFLAKEVMEEIPGQFMSYMEDNNIQPQQPSSSNSSNSSSSSSSTTNNHQSDKLI